MAEAIGLAVGVVSLGLQTSSGIASYLDAVKCRADEIASVRRKNDTLQSILLSIKESLSHLKVHDGNIPLKSAVGECIATCEVELKTLKQLAADLAGCDIAALGWKTKMKQQVRKLAYALDRPKLQQLETRLSQANTTLQLALQSVSLDVSRLAVDKLTAVETAVELSMHMQRQDLEEATKFIGQLVARPGNLRAVCNTVVPVYAERVATRSTPGHIGNESHILPTHSDRIASPSNQTFAAHDSRTVNRLATLLPPNMVCLCKRAGKLGRQVQRRSQFWGPLYLYQDTDTMQHLPRCPFHQVATKQRDQTTGMRVTGLKYLLGAAIEISFNMRSGAGGWGISPAFTYYPTVDTKSAPAFRIVELMKELFYRISREDWYICHNDKPASMDNPTETVPVMDESTRARFVRLALIKMVKLFQGQEKGASPLEVDSENRSLMHAVAAMIQRVIYFELMTNSLLEFVQVLIDCGVPTLSYDADGWLPVQYLLEERMDPEHQTAVSEAWDVMFGGQPSNSQVTIEKFRDDIGCGDQYLTFFRSLKGCAEAYGTGPLSLAALTNDSSQVAYLLKHHPTTLKEQNIYGHTPLHMAADNPLCLRTLVQVADIALINQVDASGASTLHDAMRHSRIRCRSDTREPGCPSCNCEACVVILLESDCAVTMPPGYSFSVLFKSSSATSTLQYIHHMKDRRERLKQLALDNLSHADQMRFGLLNPLVLDHHAPGVVGALKDKGVQIPAALAIDGKTPYESIYNVRSKEFDYQAACVLYGLGFQDTGPFSVRGKSLKSLWRPSEPDHVYWLFEHGADFLRPLSTQALAGQGLSTAHAVFFRLGSSSVFVVSPDLSLRFRDMQLPLNRLYAAVLPLDLVDNCRCRCSPGGCTPLTYLLKRMSLFPPKFRYTLRLGFISRFIFYMENFNPDWSTRDYVAVHRVLVFEALQITHTCCTLKRSGRHKGPHTRDEANEIESEEEALLERFEDLVTELEEELRTRLAISPDLGGFWSGFWSDRIAEEREKLQSSNISETTRRQAEEVGVVWESGVVGCAPKPDLAKNPYSYREAEYWFYELDKIAVGGD